MDANSIITVAVGVAASAGGYVSGRRNNGVAAETINIMAAQINTLKDQAATIPMLNTRIEVLESLVTQRAEVEAVKQIVTRIEEKLDERSS
jgi:hypothetical protein